MLINHLADARTWIIDAESKIKFYRGGHAAAGVAAVVRRALIDNFHTTATADVKTISHGFSALCEDFPEPLF